MGIRLPRSALHDRALVAAALGYYKLHRPKEQASDWVWIIDHSNQIGKEKCLVILGVRVSQLPPPGQEYPLCLAQMEPIELEPVTVSDKEVVYRQLVDTWPRPVFLERSSTTTVATWRAGSSCSVRPIPRQSRIRHEPQGRMPAQSAAETPTHSGSRSPATAVNQVQHPANGMGVSRSPANGPRPT